MTACLVVTIVGGLVHLFIASIAAPPTTATVLGRVQELGRIAFFVGLLWLVHLLSEGHPLKLGG